MNCQECRNLFDDMLDRRIKEPLKRRMQIHLTNCAKCSSRLERRRKAHAALFRALNHFDGLEHLPDDFADRLVAECRRPQAWWQNVAVPKWVLIAASLVIMAGFAFAATVAVDALMAKDSDGEETVGRAVPNAPQATEVTDGSDALAAPSAMADAPYVTEVASVPYEENPSYADNQLKGENEMNIKHRAAAALAAATLAANVAQLKATEGNTLISWTAGDGMEAERVSLADGKVQVYCDADGNVTNLVAMPEAGETLILTGDAMTFAAGAFVSIAAKGALVFRNDVVGSGDLTVHSTAADRTITWHENLLLDTTRRIIFTDKNLDEWEVVDGTNTQPGNTNPNWMWAYHHKRKEGVLTVQMQWFGGSEQWYTGHETYWKVVELELSQQGADIVARKLGAWTAHLPTSGAEFLGSDIDELWPDIGQSRYCPTLKWYGYGIDTLRMRPAGVYKVRFEGETTVSGALTADAFAVVEVIGATAATATRYNADGDLTLIDPMDNLALPVIGGCGTFTLEATDSALPVRTVTMSSDNVMTNRDSRGFSPTFPTVAIKGTAQTHLSFHPTTANAVPHWSSTSYTRGRIDIQSGGELLLTATMDNNSPPRIVVQKDGALNTKADGAYWQTAMRDQIVVKGGTLNLGYGLPDTYLYSYAQLNFLTLYDGACVTGLPMRSSGGDYAPVWTVRGAEPSRCDALLRINGKGANAAVSRVFTFDIADVTEGSATDFFMNNEVMEFEGAPNLLVKKIGAGTIQLNKKITMRGDRVEVAEGTWLLGASGITAATDPYTLSGGVLATAVGTMNSLGVLTVGGTGGRISLGANAILNFADSRTAAWAGPLVIEGYRDNAIRFGTSVQSLTDAQQAVIKTADGKRLHLLSNGYLSTYGFVVTIH